MDEKCPEMLRQVVEYFVAVTEDKGMLEAESFNDLVEALKALVGRVQKYCQDKEDLKLEGIKLYDTLDQLCAYLQDYDGSLEYAKKYYEEVKNINNEEELNAARTFLGTAYHNAALGIAATVLEKNEPGEYDTDKVPESDRKKCEALSAKAAEYFHEAYIGFLHLALSQAAKLHLVDSALCEQLDDDHLLSTVETLTKSIEDCENREDKEIAMIVDCLDHAMEASDHVLVV